MEFRTKRLLSMFVVCCYLFLGGVEFAAILPTAWEYLTYLGATKEYYLGITVAAYSMSAAIAGIVGGWWSDKYPDSTKTVSLACIVIMVIGNLEYMLGVGVWNIVISRFICGIGTGAGAALLAFVCRTTTTAERTAVISVCNSARQMGILIGPAFQMMLINIDFQIGPLKVTRLNAVGLLMAILWLGFIFILIPMFNDITYEWQQRQAQQARRGYVDGEESEDQYEVITPYLRSMSRTISMCESISVQAPPENVPCWSYNEELFQKTMVSLLGTVFTLFFGQILVETMIPIYMKEYFMYHDIETSLMYTGGGFECVLLLGILVGLSRGVPDWVLHLVGLLLVFTGFCWLCVTTPTYQKGDSSNLWSFIGGCLFVGAGYPITSVANAALVSKCLSVESQGIGQGMRRLMSYLGLMVGPLWAGATASNPGLMMGVAVGLVLIQLVMYLYVLPSMVRVERRVSSASSAENTPLIAPRDLSRYHSRRSWTSSGGFSADEDSISSVF